MVKKTSSFKDINYQNLHKKKQIIYIGLLYKLELSLKTVPTKNKNKNIKKKQNFHCITGELRKK